MAGIVVIFDFDKTIIDCDSDNWVVDELGFTELFNQLLPTMPWNFLMDKMMKEINARGTTIDDIVEVLKRTPIHPRIVPAIKSAHALGCELRVVSDANMFFIEKILEHLGLRQCFSEINTNPSVVDEDDKLRIFPHHDFTKSSHGCSLCPPNMCKGMVVERIQASFEGKKKNIIYLGDGSGDYCPALKLGEADYMMPRKNFPVWDLICSNPMLIKAGIHEWSDGEELEKVLLQIINTVAVEGDGDKSSQLISSVDCKLQTISASTTALPQAMPVPQ
ncbi:Inorganic pyrophosphatase 1 [Hibiscus syriacus]|uniref:Inorganic pyrophosphatase 1 n=1 Tax=Hibiscus syriacus TaxID=106335 RepID=A0A6A2Y449_HIBSY|nr:inorganic pyrophosphatase 2-like [Hibiscus syriacus]KAE8667109.1 Inorganic pyrophosphatase 1 [Hibiscus syriacus]